MPFEVAELPLIHLVRPPRVEVHKPPLLIMLHGLGGNENDLFDLAQDFDERFLLLCPRGPFAIMSRSYNWLSNARPDPNTSWETPQTAQSCLVLQKFIKEAVRAYKADPTQVYLCGFSQGATLALSAMVSEPEILAGVVAMSGQMPAEFHMIPVPNDRLKDFPIMVTHGIQDDIHPLGWGHALRDVLLALVTDLTFREYKTGHQISKDVLSDVRTWLTYRLNIKGVTSAAYRISSPPDYGVALRKIHLRVRNLDRSIGFYTHILGMQLMERAGNAYAFLGFKNDSQHHVIKLENIGSNAPTPPRNSTGVQFVAFEVKDCLSFASAYKRITDAGVRVATTDHTISWSMYFHDPDRNGIEIYWDTRHLPGKSHLWQGRDLPLDREHLLGILVEQQHQKGT